MIRGRGEIYEEGGSLFRNKEERASDACEMVSRQVTD